MRGLGLIEDGSHSWWLPPPAFTCAACGQMSPLSKPKRTRALRECVAALADSIAIVYDPIAPMRMLPDYQPKVQRQIAAFLRQFPACGSVKFSGGLVLHGKQVLPDLLTAHELFSNGDGRAEMSVVFKLSRVLFLICDHQGVHVCARTRKSIEALAKVLQKVTGAALGIERRDG